MPPSAARPAGGAARPAALLLLTLYATTTAAAATCPSAPVEVDYATPKIERAPDDDCPIVLYMLTFFSTHWVEYELVQYETNGLVATETGLVIDDETLTTAEATVPPHLHPNKTFYVEQIANPNITVRLAFTTEGPETIGAVRSLMDRKGVLCVDNNGVVDDPSHIEIMEDDRVRCRLEDELKGYNGRVYALIEPTGSRYGGEGVRVNISSKDEFATAWQLMLIWILVFIAVMFVPLCCIFVITCGVFNPLKSRPIDGEEIDSTDPGVCILRLPFYLSKYASYLVLGMASFLSAIFVFVFGTAYMAAWHGILKFQEYANAAERKKYHPAIQFVGFVLAVAAVVGFDVFRTVINISLLRASLELSFDVPSLARVTDAIDDVLPGLGGFTLGVGPIFSAMLDLESLEDVYACGSIILLLYAMLGMMGLILFATTISSPILQYMFIKHANEVADCPPSWRRHVLRAMTTVMRFIVLYSLQVGISSLSNSAPKVWQASYSHCTFAEGAGIYFGRAFLAVVIIASWCRSIYLAMATGFRDKEEPTPKKKAKVADADLEAGGVEKPQSLFSAVRTRALRMLKLPFSAYDAFIGWCSSDDKAERLGGIMASILSGFGQFLLATFGVWTGRSADFFHLKATTDEFAGGEFADGGIEVVGLHVGLTWLLFPSGLLLTKLAEYANWSPGIYLAKSPPVEDSNAKRALLWLCNLLKLGAIAGAVVEASATFVLVAILLSIPNAIVYGRAEWPWNHEVVKPKVDQLASDAAAYRAPMEVVAAEEEEEEEAGGVGGIAGEYLAGETEAIQDEVIEDMRTGGGDGGGDAETKSKGSKEES